MEVPKFPPQLGDWLPGRPFSELPFPAWRWKGGGNPSHNNPGSDMEGLERAYKWAAQSQHKSVLATAALAYIDALDLAKTEAKMLGRSPQEGERTQLVYILSNLTSWRGPEAKEAKEALKKRIDELSKRY